MAERTAPDGPGVADASGPAGRTTLWFAAQGKQPPDRGLPGWLRGLGWIAGCTALAVLGLVVAAAGIFVSRTTVDVFGWGVPLGMVLAVAGTAAAFEGSRLLLGRAGGFAVLGGWLAGMAALLLPRSAGDVVLANDGYGVGFGLLGAGIFLWAAHRSASR